MLPRLDVEPSLAGFTEQVTQKTAWNNLDIDSSLFLQVPSIFLLEYHIVIYVAPGYVPVNWLRLGIQKQRHLELLVVLFNVKAGFLACRGWDVFNKNGRFMCL